MKRIIILVFVLFTISLQAEKIQFKVLWYPQAQFAGYIMALEKGFFNQNNLDVELQFSKGNDDIIIPETLQ